MLGIAGYAGVYYTLYRMWPFETNTGAADTILAQAQVPAQMQAFPSGNAVATPSSSPQLQHGRVEQGNIPSTFMNGAQPYMIYLPPHYDTSDRRYPVVYLLHGAPGGYADWMKGGGIDHTLDALISVGRIPPLIAVLPDGDGGFFGDTQWANSPLSGVRAEDYLTQEVVPFIDQHYHTLADRHHRIMGGLSAGGFGAVNITLHHPDLFGAAFSLSGNYVAWPTWTGKDMWGNDPALKEHNSPLLYAPHVANVRDLHLYLASGQSDKSSRPQTEQFDAVLNQLDVPHKTDYFDGGHAWEFWRTHVVDALKYLIQDMPVASLAQPRASCVHAHEGY
jgi:enterochelin esterase-like enzyme